MKHCIVLVGPPGSGKSTFASKLELTGYVRISQDDQGKDGHLKAFKDAIEAGQKIVVDRMNFSKEQRNRYLSVAKEHGYETAIFSFIVQTKECLRRMEQRTNHPTITCYKEARSALDTFLSKFQPISSEEADIIITEKGLLKDKEQAIYCDIDGTIADLSHRLNFVRGEGKKDWKLFFSTMPEDKPIMEIIHILRTYKETGMKIVLCSGRPDDYRKQTEEWLNKHDIPYDELFMRYSGDFRQDNITKEVLLEYEILPKYNIFFALDDRQQVVDMLRSKGLKVLQVAKGDF
jgi:predicted kinase